MRDYYRALNLTPYAAQGVLVDALRSADPQVRSAATFILLDQRRRQIYDRDHRLLTTISRLRTNLGLNHTRFWARREYKDFWSETASVPSPRGRAVDAMMIVAAFGKLGRHGRKHIRRKRSWLIAVVVAAVVIVLGWMLRRMAA